MHLESPKRKYVSDWKSLLQKCLPAVFAVALALATVLTVVAQQANEQEYVDNDLIIAELEAQKQELATQKQELASAMSQAQELLDRLSASNNSTQALLQEAEKQVDDKIDELNSAYENVENKERQQWVLPMQYKNISSPYGYREHPVQGEAKFHSGVDMAADLGTPIVAARSGTVKIAEYIEDDAGYWVLIDHMDGFESAYMHMDKYIVAAGQFVVAGQIIGYCGSSGVATGNHLHFEIRDNNRTVNPATYIELY